ncbi:hypothetical protein E2C01_041983 [Portunus trituberculatus]|uniref:Uncharacterized protein n=1 Tax=Portunus trituberculatus TaxID=210409 RepID=A0A5B7FV74_PORTR|nr:hypothetical protein [Portunus trituberculatus]
MKGGREVHRSLRQPQEGAGARRGRGGQVVAGEGVIKGAKKNTPFHDPPLSSLEPERSRGTSQESQRTTGELFLFSDSSSISSHQNLNPGGAEPAAGILQLVFKEKKSIKKHHISFCHLRNRHYFSHTSSTHRPLLLSKLSKPARERACVWVGGWVGGWLVGGWWQWEGVKVTRLHEGQSAGSAGTRLQPDTAALPGIVSACPYCCASWTSAAGDQGLHTRLLLVGGCRGHKQQHLFGTVSVLIRRMPSTSSPRWSSAEARPLPL